MLRTACCQEIEICLANSTSQPRRNKADRHDQWNREDSPQWKHNHRGIKYLTLLDGFVDDPPALGLKVFKWVQPGKDIIRHELKRLLLDDDDFCRTK